MRTRPTAGAALGLALLAAWPAQAQPVPDRLCPYSYETRVVRPSIVRAEARVSCVVERDVRLAQRAVAEARQALGQAIGTAESATRGKAVKDREEHAFTWTTEPAHVTGRVASLLTTVQETVGSARPRFSPRTLTWDLERGVYVTLNELLREPRPGGASLVALRDAVRAALRAQVDGDPAVLDAIKAEPASFRHWTLSPGADPERAGGITVHYGSNALLGRAVTAFVPSDVLMPHLAPARRDLFGPPPR